MRTCNEITCNYIGNELYTCPNCEKRFCYQHQTIPDASWHKCKPTNDGTAGHSKGNWSYYGDTIVGLHTDCQHTYTPPDHKTGDEDGPYAYPSHEHEGDDLIPWMNEQIFDGLTAKIDTTWDEYRSNLRLMALAQFAPHDCGDPECPGVINKRKLELYDKFQVAINEFAKAGLLT